MRRDKNIGAWEQHLSKMRQRCAGTFSTAGPLDVPCIRYVDGVAYVHRLCALFWRYREESTEQEGLACLSLCCFEPPHDKLCLLHDALEWWRELVLSVGKA